MELYLSVKLKLNMPSDSSIPVYDKMCGSFGLHLPCLQT